MIIPKFKKITVLRTLTKLKSVKNIFLPNIFQMNRITLDNIIYTIT